ncbi:MAG TPA: transglycosylase SLT domain-containing protein [Steroidobacteraceae bacterium]|jgi:membrane-bound lytic murein transglycosylase D|nr:transglycosylase SLT domain-containing protein [Steroidobacteraceae bacterium]
MKRLLFTCCLLLLSSIGAASDAQLPRPPELEPDVQFWIRVYTEITTNAGFLHDQHNLSVVYETLRFDVDTPPRERARKVDEERERYHDILLRLANGDDADDADARHIKELWGAEGTPLRFQQAADDVRWQLGQADRFRAGLARAGAWQTHIGAVLANLGLPDEIAALPHVESSFDPYAYSKVGAAGLWQFMRSTGRRFMRIDSAVDERLDPYRATEAAAQLLSYNYRLLGSWPLAITAYNHGAEGMRRARDQLGTDDIVRIVRDYHSPSFGFASRNFYVSFLAALTVSRNPDKYFSGLQHTNESSYREVQVPVATSAASLVRTLGMDRDQLRSLNPALLPTVWNGTRPVPPNYILRLPGTSRWTTESLAARLGVRAPVNVAAAAVVTSAAKPIIVASAPATHVPAPAAPPIETTHVQPPATVASVATPAAASAPAASATPQPGTAEYYVVQSGDTLEAISANAHLPVKKLMTLNALHEQDDIYEGQRLRLVAEAPEPETVTTAATVEAAKVAIAETEEDKQAVRTARRLEAKAEPVTRSEAQAEGPELVSGTVNSASVDPVDYSVGSDHTIRVAAAETLGHYADWLGIPAARLRTLNHLKGRKPVVMARRLKLEFNAVTPEQFEHKRRDYHERLEAAYFAAHRIGGTEAYIARKGDSLWSITQRSVKVPVWLLQQYNPDLDFGDLKPGTQISLPKVEDVTSL